MRARGELLTETSFTRPVEFHSFRRAFKQALADAGVELQTAMTLSGASDAKTHRRYLLNTAKARAIPEAALPQLSMSRAQLPEPENENGLFCSGRSRDRTGVSSWCVVGAAGIEPATSSV